MLKWAVVVLGVSAVLLGVFVFGVIVGVEVGLDAASIDYCTDDTSEKYIFDSVVRQEVCF